MSVLKLLVNAKIFTPEDRGRPAPGHEQAKLAVYSPGAMLIVDGQIELIGSPEEVLPKTVGREISQTIDAGGRCVIPGFVDPHTHMCFAAIREEEFALRLQGVTYMEIHRRGGGIMNSVLGLRKTSIETLLTCLHRELKRSLSFGVTTVEIKSGYGLSVEHELLMLQAINRADRTAPQDVVPTFMGAHAVPEEFRNDRGTYIRIILEEMLPAVAEKNLARFCDVFTEDGVFSVEESSRILKKAKGLGLKLKAHVDEIKDLGGAAMAAELGCISAEHLLQASDRGLKAMAEAGTIAVLLPGTAFSLRKPYARAREMMEMGIPVAIATDCNPGSCYTESMPFMFTLAVLQMGFSVEEALTASTLNAAYAIDTGNRAGSLAPGKKADFLILEGESPACIPYHQAVNPVAQVFKLGERVYARQE